MKLAVDTNFANVYFDEIQIASFSAVFSPIWMAGAFVVKGYENTAWFQNLEIEE